MQISKGRYAARIEGDFVVFLIGMRINRLLLPHRWLPTVFAMPRMLKEMAKQPELGMLNAQTFVSGRTILVVQYWRSFDQLHTYAHAKNFEHLPAWAEFNRKVGGNGSVGIFHESYLVKAGQYESLSVNMPRSGLAKAGEVVSATGHMAQAEQPNTTVPFSSDGSLHPNHRRKRTEMKCTPRSITQNKRRPLMAPRDRECFPLELSLERSAVQTQNIGIKLNSVLELDLIMRGSIGFCQRKK